MSDAHSLHPWKNLPSCVENLTPGQASTIAACIAAGLASGNLGWVGQLLTAGSAIATVASSRRPITIRKADGATMASQMHRLSEGGAASAGADFLFPADAEGIHAPTEHWQRDADLDHAREPMLGLGMIGPKYGCRG